MKLSKSSWHYQFINFFFDLENKRTGPMSLCRYMRLFVGAVFEAIFVTFIVICSIGLLFFLFYTLTRGEYLAYERIIKDMPIDMSDLDKNAEGLACIVDSLVMLFVVLAACLGIAAFFGWLGRMSFLRLVWEYLKAIKNRVCPLMEIVE